METFTVDLTFEEAKNTIKEFVLHEGASTECVAEYEQEAQDGKKAVFLVFEKYYMRNSSRASLSIIIENLKGETKVCAVGSGGGSSALFKFDWGTANNFANVAREAVKGHILGEKQG